MKQVLKNLIFYPGMIILSIVIISCQRDGTEIQKAVKAQMQQYPASTLQDIYKSFFQDEFGPGHLIEDVSVAREYFDLELEDMVSHGRREAEPCGTGKNFYRIPMDLVKDGIIPEDAYFESFMESSKDFKTPDIKTWEKKWEEILKEIEPMDIQLPHMERDKKAIAGYLKQGGAVVHHSDPFNSTYDPHYRIFSKVQWEKLKESFIARRTS